MALDIENPSDGVYAVVTDFSNAEPLAAVTATNNMTFQLQYYVTETAANTTITEIDGAAQMGVNLQQSGTSDASGTFVKNYCANSAYLDSGGANPIPDNLCFTSTGNVQFSQWNSSNGHSASGDPTDPANQNVQNGSATGISLTSAGIFDQVLLNGGSHDGPTPGQYQAALNNFENDFIDTTASTTAPEPGTFLLMGGALIGLAAIRRKKSA